MYLQDGNVNPIVISSALDIEQERKLITLLRNHKKAIGWALTDLKRINPLIYTHKKIDKVVYMG